MAENGPGQDPFGDDPRIDRIGEKLREIDQKGREGKQSGTGAVDANYRLGNRVLADLIAGVVGGALFGWLFDRWFGTSPWLLIVFLFLGIIVAFRNIIRVSNAHSERLRVQQDEPPGSGRD
ncbi:MAG: AtpZ/AtpI family protein [Blastomonas sp.]